MVQLNIRHTIRNNFHSSQVHIYTSHRPWKEVSNESAGYIDFSIPPIDDNRKIVLATVLALILTIGILTNVFIIVCTFCHPKSIKSSSIIFLLGSSFANVIPLVSLISVQIVVTSAEEWVFGSTTEEKELACAINAYFTGLSYRTASYSLATISVDRFVFLVKPRYFKPVPSAVALVVIMLLLAVYQVIPTVFGRAVFNPLPTTPNLLQIFP